MIGIIPFSCPLGRYVQCSWFKPAFGARQVQLSSRVRANEHSLTCRAPQVDANSTPHHSREQGTKAQNGIGLGGEQSRPENEEMCSLAATFTDEIYGRVKRNACTERQ